jgi:hypothetical protein
MHVARSCSSVFGETSCSWPTSRLGCTGSLSLGLQFHHSRLDDPPSHGGVAAKLQALAVYGVFDKVQDSCRILQVERRVLTFTRGLLAKSVA